MTMALRCRPPRQAPDPGLFGALLLELSVRFVHLPPEQVDGEIESALCSVCEFLGIHRSGVYQGMPEITGKWQLTHIYQHPDHATIVRNPDGSITPRGGWRRLPPDVPPHMVVDAHAMFPWVSARIGSDEIVVINSLDEIPDEGARDRLNYEQVGSRSILVFPLVAGGRVFGGLLFVMVGEERTWEQAVIDNLHLVSQILGNAIARKSADMALRRSEERLSLATTSAKAALWSFDGVSGSMWVNDVGQEMFAVKEGVSWERFLALLHPEDRSRVEEAYRTRFVDPDAEIEYRFVRPDGSVRWAVTRGRRQGGPGPGAVLTGVTLDITDRKENERRLAGQLREITELKQRLEAEVVVLRDEVQSLSSAGEILGTSDAVQYTHYRIGQVAPLDTTVLIQGETGTGKNLAAAAIHARSGRKDRPMVTVSCAALPGNLIESELFGRDRGAFTGADQMRRGRFEVADGSTIFLDEIGELPLDLQAKLLRVVQSGEFERLGSPKTIKVDVRIIAASNRDLQEAVNEGRFRADLFYRLNVFPITLPPLRDRQEDIPALVRTLVEKFARKTGRPITTIHQSLIQVLQGYSWPGNVRELENVIERAVIVSPGPVLHLAETLSGSAAAEKNGHAPLAADPGTTLEDVEREHIRRTLDAVGWRVQGKGGAADLLGLNPSTLRARMRKLGIQREAVTEK